MRDGGEAGVARAAVVFIGMSAAGFSESEARSDEKVATMMLTTLRNERLVAWGGCLRLAMLALDTTDVRHLVTSLLEQRKSVRVL